MLKVITVSSSIFLHLILVKIDVNFCCCLKKLNVVNSSINKEKSIDVQFK